MLEYIEENVRRVLAQIEEAAQKSGRRGADITLVAASKTMPKEAIRRACAAGVRVFGENRVQELTQKRVEGAYEGAALHFIGRLQTNKVRGVVGAAELLQSLDSLRLAEAVEAAAARAGTVQQVLVEVNIAREENKGGIVPEALPEFLDALRPFPHLAVRGLMTVAPVPEHPESNRAYFEAMRQILVDNNPKGWDNITMKTRPAVPGERAPMDILSMGMSADYIAAIEAGATMVRVGNAIFGQRPA